MSARWALRGLIASAGFATGDRFVIGHWQDSPVGPLDDVMWAAPDGTRTLLVGDRAGADFITAVYRFDAVVVAPVRAASAPRSLVVDAGPIAVSLEGGTGIRIPFPRPAWFTRRVEGPIARALLGVRTYGVTESGVREWYRADEHRRVVAGRATVDGRDLGALAPVWPPCRFGFSEPPKRPSLVRVRPLLEDPAGRLDDVIAAGRADRAARPRS